MPTPPPTRDIDALRRIMADLRTPGTGCPWDLEQTFATIAPYTIEEAYEVADAIERDALDELTGELGDLLLQVVYHAQMAAEAGAFTFEDVVTSICEKMIRRHPHVYGDRVAEGAHLAKGFWEGAKRRERTGDGGAPGILEDVPRALPALARATKLQRRAAAVGFDWPATEQVLGKVKEEIAEIEDEIGGNEPERLEDEIGDLLFAVANLARHLEVDAEAALRRANDKFTRRFAHIEERLAASGRSPEVADLDEMEALWQDAKERGE